MLFKRLSALLRISHDKGKARIVIPFGANLLRPPQISQRDIRRVTFTAKLTARMAGRSQIQILQKAV